jgi:hypothetical protein
MTLRHAAVNVEIAAGVAEMLIGLSSHHPPPAWRP